MPDAEIKAEARRVAADVLTLARIGVPFSEARAMDEVERQAYLAVLAVPQVASVPAEESEPMAEPTGLNVIC